MTQPEHNEIIACHGQLTHECSQTNCSLKWSRKVGHMPDWCGSSTVKTWWRAEKGHLCGKSYSQLVKLTADGHWIDQHGNVHLYERRDNES